MALEVTNDTEAPTRSTVSRYTVFRLGAIPVLTVGYTETVEDGVNVFGITAQRQAQTGRNWEISLRAETPENVQAMGQMLVGIMLNIGRTLLTQLELSDGVTDEELLAAVQGMDNVDSFLATAMENLEISRRLGQAPAISVMGQAPQIVN